MIKSRLIRPDKPGDPTEAPKLMEGFHSGDVFLVTGEGVGIRLFTLHSSRVCFKEHCISHKRLIPYFGKVELDGSM